MSGHVVDRFVRAVWPDWKSEGPNDPMPDGEYHVSPEIGRMLVEHLARFGYAEPHDSIFGQRVIVDTALPRGAVVHVPRSSA